jgi:hypothetical protein
MHAAALHCTRLHGVLENSAVSRSAHQVMKSSMWRQGQNRHLPSPSEIARPRQCPSVIRRLLLAHPCLLAPSLAWQYKSRAPARPAPRKQRPTRLDRYSVQAVGL